MAEKHIIYSIKHPMTRMSCLKLVGAPHHELILANDEIKFPTKGSVESVFNVIARLHFITLKITKEIDGRSVKQKVLKHKYLPFKFPSDKKSQAYYQKLNKLYGKVKTWKQGIELDSGEPESVKEVWDKMVSNAEKITSYEPVYHYSDANCVTALKGVVEPTGVEFKVPKKRLPWDHVGLDSDIWAYIFAQTDISTPHEDNKSSDLLRMLEISKP